MTTYKGVGVYAGRVIGPVLQMPKPIEEPKDGLRLSGETAEAAAQRIKDASVRVKEDLLARAEHASRDGKAVLKSTSQMATDRALIKSAIKLVETQEMAPERAIWRLQPPSLTRWLPWVATWLSASPTSTTCVPASLLS